MLDKNLRIRELKEFLESDYRVMINDIKLLELSMTHSSNKNDSNPKNEDNERLEFLGDGIMKASLRDLLYEKNPAWDEGRLSKMMTEYESNEELRGPARIFGIHNYILLGNSFGGKIDLDATYMENALEALIGAIYLDKGFPVTKKFVDEIVLSNFNSNKNTDYISEVHKYADRYHIQVKEIMVFEESGTHDNIFEIKVLVGTYEGFGSAGSKPRARKIACKEIYDKLQNEVMLIQNEYQIDYKTLIHDYSFDKYKQKSQDYMCKEIENGMIECSLFINGTNVATGYASNNKNSKIEAAKKACDVLGLTKNVKE